MIDLLESKREQLADFCRRYGVRSLFVFGSAASDEYRPGTSDVDLLVEFLPGVRGGGLRDVYFQLRDDLRSLLGCEVDLVEAGAVRNPYVRASIDRSRVPLYAAASWTFATSSSTATT
ncbi:MAG TPA: nucleotidyltransferase family protein [Phycisphaerales bacterium]|nr:nucleotidyltransferase family protein [Phycisphaerales bacterium]